MPWGEGNGEGETTLLHYHYKVGEQGKWVGVVRKLENIRFI